VLVIGTCGKAEWLIIAADWELSGGVFVFQVGHASRAWNKAQ